MVKNIFRLKVVFLLLLVLAVSAAAELKFSRPVIGNWTADTSAIEQGAYFTVTVLYDPTDAPGGAANLTASSVYLQYDTIRLADPVLTDLQGANFDQGRFRVLSGTDSDIIEYAKYSSPGRSVAVVSTPVPLFSIRFHLLETAAAGNSFDNLVNWPTRVPYNDPSNYQIVYATDPVSGSRVTKTGAITRTALSIAGALPPTFTGLAAGDGRSGSSGTADNNIGNTITLNWSGHVTADLDLRADSGGRSTQTRFVDGKLGYHVYRSPGDAAFTPAAGNRLASYITSGSTRGNLGDYIVRNGPGTGVPGTGTEAVSDCYPYSFTVRAQDDCSPAHPETNTGRIAVISHDYVAPSTPTNFQVLATNEALIVSWTNPPEPDFGGVMVVREPGVYPTPVLTDASGVADGTRPPATAGGAAPGDSGATVAYVGSGTGFTDTSLRNGTFYNYRIYAYDRAVAAGAGDPPSTPREQGNNWSDPAEANRAPGVPASALRNFCAVSSPEVGQITLYWDKPAEAWYGGAVFWYTTDFTNKWDWYKNWGDAASNAIDRLDDDPSDWLRLRDAGNIGVLAVYKTDPAILPGQQERLVISRDGAGRLLDLTQVYFIKGLAYNATAADLPTTGAALTTDILRGHRFADERLAASLPAGTSGGAIRLSYDLKPSQTDRLVVNSITIPPGTTLRRASELVGRINEKAGLGRDIVTIIGKWDPDGARSLGYKPLTGGGYEGSDFDLTAGEGYQLYVKERATITLP